MDNIDLFTQLYESVYIDLYHFALYMLKSQQDAEDAVQDCVMSAYEQFTKLRNIAAFRPWIFKILTNQCKRKMRRYYQPTVALYDEIPYKDQDHDQNTDLKNALLTLSDEDRMIVLLSIYAGYTSLEIAGILKKNPNTVRSRLSRALLKMQPLIQE